MSFLFKNNIFILHWETFSWGHPLLRNYRTKLVRTHYKTFLSSSIVIATNIKWIILDIATIYNIFDIVITINHSGEKLLILTHSAEEPHTQGTDTSGEYEQGPPSISN